MNKRDGIKTKIKSLLAMHPEGMTILEISRFIQMHRHTATKYVYELIGAGVIYERQIGPAKLCYLSSIFSGRRRKRR